MRLNDPLMLTIPPGIDLDYGSSGDDGAKADVVASLLGFCATNNTNVQWNMEILLQ